MAQTKTQKRRNALESRETSILYWQQRTRFDPHAERMVRIHTFDAERLREKLGISTTNVQYPSSRYDILDIIADPLILDNEEGW